MTPCREMFRDYEPCTDGDFLSAADKGELKIEGYGKLSLKFRGRNFTLPLNKVARVLSDVRRNLKSLSELDDAGKRFIVGRGCIIMCVTHLMFKRLFETYVGRSNRIQYREDDTTQITSRDGSYPRHQASVALIRPGDRAFKTGDIDLMYSSFNHSNVRILVRRAHQLAHQLGVAVTGTLQYRQPLHRP